MLLATSNKVIFPETKRMKTLHTKKKSIQRIEQLNSERERLVVVLKLRKHILIFHIQKKPVEITIGNFYRV